MIVCLLCPSYLNAACALVGQSEKFRAYTGWSSNTMHQSSFMKVDAFLCGCLFLRSSALLRVVGAMLDPGGGACCSQGMSVTSVITMPPHGGRLYAKHGSLSRPLLSTMRRPPIAGSGSLPAAHSRAATKVRHRSRLGYATAHWHDVPVWSVDVRMCINPFPLPGIRHVRRPERAIARPGLRPL